MAEWINHPGKDTSNNSKTMVRQNIDNGAAFVDVRSGGATIAPTNYTGNVEVASITGLEVDTMATGATKVRVIVQAVTGSPGALYVAFGADTATSVANVNATSGSETGMLLSLTPADGDEFLITIPSSARNGGSLAAGITGYSNGVNELVINITQGV